MSDQQIHLLGFGRLGHFIYDQAAHRQEVIGMIYNRTRSNISVDHPDGYCFDDLGDFMTEGRASDARHLTIEASHPRVVAEVGRACLEYGDVMITSLTALMDGALMDAMRRTAEEHGHTLFIPEGAGWGIDNIRKMDAMSLLTGIEVDMFFSPSALRLSGDDAIHVEDYISSETTAPTLVAEGKITDLAIRAPNNVNTMCALRLAASSLTDQQVVGRLWADASQHAHRVKIVTHGPDGFYTEVLRYNPAKPGAVTGQMTFSSFWASIERALEHRHADPVRFV